MVAEVENEREGVEEGHADGKRRPEQQGQRLGRPVILWHQLRGVVYIVKSFKQSHKLKQVGEAQQTQEGQARFLLHYKLLRKSVFGALIYHSEINHRQ